MNLSTIESMRCLGIAQNFKISIWKRPQRPLWSTLLQICAVIIHCRRECFLGHDTHWLPGNLFKCVAASSVGKHSLTPVLPPPLFPDRRLTVSPARGILRNGISFWSIVQILSLLWAFLINVDLYLFVYLFIP